MKTVISEEILFNCSLERAFKTPMLGATTLFLVGYGIIPPIEKFTEGESWGKEGGKRIPHTASKSFMKGGPVGL